MIKKAGGPEWVLEYHEPDKPGQRIEFTGLHELQKASVALMSKFHEMQSVL